MSTHPIYLLIQATKGLTESQLCEVTEIAHASRLLLFPQNTACEIKSENSSLYKKCGRFSRPLDHLFMW